MQNNNPKKGGGGRNKNLVFEILHRCCSAINKDSSLRGRSLLLVGQTKKIGHRFSPKKAGPRKPKIGMGAIDFWIFPEKWVGATDKGWPMINKIGVGAIDFFGDFARKRAKIAFFWGWG